MKAIWHFALIFLAFLAFGVCDARIPDLVGDWTGTMDGYIQENGSLNLTKNADINITITEQTGRLFHGNVSFSLNREDEVISVLGAIGPDNETLYLSSSNGLNLGKLKSDNEIELIFLQSGEAIEAFIDVFHRKDQSQ